MWKIIAVLALIGFLPGHLAAQSAPALEVLDRNGEQTQAITDGDLVQLHLTLGQPAEQDSTATFHIGLSRSQAAACTISRGARECTTPPARAFGWYWADGANPAGTERVITVSFNDQADIVSLPVSVRPRPVVMVHGFISDYAAWASYLGEQGYLAARSIPGFAVGDGQVEGVMNTGSLDQPTTKTNTIAQNAVILRQYIDQVKAKTGAEVVDLLGHSMGGLISRYYLDRLMPERDVAQLIMLGTPSAGSDCAILPASLGFYYPTVLEIRSSYILGVFNQQIRRRNQVPFFALAGTKITTPVGSPCTAIPSDMVVSVDSVNSIPLDSQETPVLHVDMNVSADIFTGFVLPLLQRPPEDAWSLPDPPAETPPSAPLQFTRVYTGRVDPGSSAEAVIQMESGLAVASFGLYDPTLSLQVEVTGASGNVIQLTADQHGLIQVDDPATLVTMGYGFANPRPGPWKIKLLATDRTPPGGASYALFAHLSGGAEARVSADPLLPAINTPVRITAEMALADAPLEIQRAEVLIRGPDGYNQPLPLAVEAGLAQADWQPPAPGLYAVDVLLLARLADGTEIERTAYLTVEAQADDQVLPAQFTLPRAGLGLVAGGVLVAGAAVFALVYRRFRRRGKDTF